MCLKPQPKTNNMGRIENQLSNIPPYQILTIFQPTNINRNTGSTHTRLRQNDFTRFFFSTRQTTIDQLTNAIPMMNIEYTIMTNGLPLTRIDTHEYPNISYAWFTCTFHRLTNEQLPYSIQLMLVSLVSDHLRKHIAHLLGSCFSCSPSRSCSLPLRSRSTAPPTLTHPIEQMVERT